MVYVVHNTGKDYSAAAKHGRMIDVLSLKEGNRPATEMVQKIKERLEPFDSEDFLLCCGDPIAIAIAFAYVADNLGEVKMLRYDPRCGAYEVVTTRMWNDD